MTASMLRWVLGGVAAAALGCSSSSGGACGDDTPCGGDITGTWNIGSACESPTFTEGTAPCPAMVKTSLSGVSGTMTFNADSTFTIRQSYTSRTDTMSKPLSCSMPAGNCSCSGTTMCTCVTSGSACSCTYPGSAGREDMDGTYTVSGGTLTLNVPTAGVVVFTQLYCVSGNTLHLFPRPSTMASLTVPALALVATRQ